jgi:hypothetical protein
MSVEDIGRLPHKDPVRFITEVKIAAEDDAASLVEFKEKPTLAAIVEAAAQNVIFIASLYRIYDGGVLTGMKNIELLRELDAGVYRVESAVTARVDNYAIFRFNLSTEEGIFVEGEMNIVMEERR